MPGHFNERSGNRKWIPLLISLNQKKNTETGSGDKRHVDYRGPETFGGTWGSQAVLVL